MIGVLEDVMIGCVRGCDDRGGRGCDDRVCWREC